MNFFIVDDDRAVRAMLRAIIEDEQLGVVIGEEEDGFYLTGERLNRENVQILLIDLLMPQKDGIETVKDLYPTFHGKVVMISQVETKEMIAEAYLHHVEHYITKPINLYEVISVLKKVSNHLRLESSIQEIQKSLQVLGIQQQATIFKNQPAHLDKAGQIIREGKKLLSDLGIRGACGSDDLLIILQYLHNQTETIDLHYSFPPLKEIWQYVATIRLEKTTNTKKDCVQKEMKACEQRVRRTIQQALSHVASLGAIDHTNPKFEELATKFFDLSHVQQKMHGKNNYPRLNIKKFLRTFYYEASDAVPSSVGSRAGK